MAMLLQLRWRRAFVALYLSGLVAFISAATTTASAAPGGPQTYKVTVGLGGDFQYHPNSISANPGDVVSFVFYPTNHSVIRGGYTGSEGCGSGGCNPCVPVELIDPAVPPFASKNFLTQDLPNPSNLALHTYNLTINDTNPIWFYCDAIDSCLSGMVGVINPQNGSSITKQIAAAQAAKFQLGPGQTWPAEGTHPGSQSLTPTSSSSSPSSSSSNSITHDDRRMTSGAIAGIAISTASVVLLCAALCWFFFARAKTYRDVLNKQRTESSLLTPGGHFPPQISPSSATESPPPPALTGDWNSRLSGQMAAGAVPPQGTADADLNSPSELQQDATVVTREIQELPEKSLSIAEVGPYH